MEDRFSRAEMIKQARDSFNRRPDHTVTHKKINIMTKEKVEADVNYRWKSFMIRTIIGIILFLLLLCADQMSFSYNKFESSTVKEIIATNQTVENIQEYSKEFAKEKIIPVFNRLW